MSIDYLNDRIKYDPADINFWTKQTGNLKHVEGKIIVSIDLEKKNWHQFDDGTKIRIERKYENLNMRYVNPVNATVISGEGLQEGAEILVHHNCIHETNRILDYQPLSGKTEASDIKYYSISENEAFAWRNPNSGIWNEKANAWLQSPWEPLKGFDFALRIFKSYSGKIIGVEPTLIKQVLWITTGEYKNKACITLQASDYELVFQDVNNKEGNIIRLRTEDNPKEQRESEIVAIHNEYTEKILNNELLVGLTKTDAKYLNEYICQ